MRAASQAFLSILEPLCHPLQRVTGVAFLRMHGKRVLLARKKSLPIQRTCHVSFPRILNLELNYGVRVASNID